MYAGWGIEDNAHVFKLGDKERKKGKEKLMQY
jgi:hypothetical protein